MFRLNDVTEELSESRKRVVQLYPFHSAVWHLFSINNSTGNIFHHNNNINIAINRNCINDSVYVSGHKISSVTLFFLWFFKVLLKSRYFVDVTALQTTGEWVVAGGIKESQTGECMYSLLPDDIKSP